MVRGILAKLINTHIQRTFTFSACYGWIVNISKIHISLWGAIAFPCNIMFWLFASETPYIGIKCPRFLWLIYWLCVTMCIHKIFQFEYRVYITFTMNFGCDCINHSLIQVLCWQCQSFKVTSKIFRKFSVGF